VDGGADGAREITNVCFLFFLGLLLLFGVGGGGRRETRKSRLQVRSALAMSGRDGSFGAWGR